MSRLLFWGDLRFTSGADRDATQTGTQRGSGVAYADSGRCAERVCGMEKQQTQKTAEERYEELRQENIRRLQREIEFLEDRIQQSQQVASFPNCFMQPIPITHDEQMLSAMCCTNIFPSPPSKSSLDKMLETLEWENSHSWLYKLIHWHEKPNGR
jgi:hypothetical protein